MRGSVNFVIYQSVIRRRGGYYPLLIRSKKIAIIPFSRSFL